MWFHLSLFFLVFFFVVCCVFPQTGGTHMDRRRRRRKARRSSLAIYKRLGSTHYFQSRQWWNKLYALANTPRSSLGNDSTAAKHQFYLALQTIQKKQSSIGKISNHTKTYSLRIHHPSAMTSNSHPDDPHRHIHASGKRSSDSSARYNYLDYSITRHRQSTFDTDRTSPFANFPYCHRPRSGHIRDRLDR